MNNVFFYLIFAILLYLVLSRVFEKFSIEQENFDPSLVPVSSIVTLAKVAQKLVNGNGVLTNPGSLQIGGSSSAPGNLTVTGNSILSGTLGVTGATTIGANSLNANIPAMTVNGNLQVNGYGLGVSNSINLGTSTNNVQLFSDGAHGLSVQNQNGGDGNIKCGGISSSGNLNIIAGSENKGISIVSGNPFISFTKTGSSGIPQIYSDGTTLHAYNAPFQVDQNLTVSGTTTLNSTTKFCKNTWHTDTDGHQRLHFSSAGPGITNGGTSYYESPNNKHEFRGGDAGAEKLAQMVLDDGNLSVSGTLKVGTSGTGFLLDNENNNGYFCIRNGNDTVGSGNGRLCFNPTTSTMCINGACIDEAKINKLNNLLGNLDIYGNYSSRLYANGGLSIGSGTYITLPVDGPNGDVI